MADAVVKLEGCEVVVTDGVFPHRFDLVSRGPGRAPGLASVVIALRPEAGLELSYESETGRLSDVQPVALEEADHG